MSRMNCFDGQGPISAEEFCAFLAPSCPIPTPPPFPCRPPVPAPCPGDRCCKSSMVSALQLLCDPALNELVDFDSFLFLTGSASVGGSLSDTAAAPVQPDGPSDNIVSASGTFLRFSPCSNDLLEVEGPAFSAAGSRSVILQSADQVNVCALKAAALQLLDQGSEEDNEVNGRRAQRAILRALTPESGTCSSTAHGGDPAGCASRLLSELSARNLSRLATFTVGGLILQNVTVVGSIGTVLILWNELQRRFYLVCAGEIEVLG